MKLRVGTRGSALALTQTKTVIAALAPDISSEIIEIKTSGDKKQGTAAARTGDKKDWVLELEMALLDGTIDLAVHCGKDIPGNIEPGTELLPVLSRATPNDIFIGKLVNDRRVSFSELTPGAQIGTSSLRRKSILYSLKRGFKPVDHRGNVGTRIAKLDESSDLSGIILAAAGVERLGALPVSEYETLPFDTMLPAMNQGILGVQFRSDDAATRSIVESISDKTLQGVFQAERRCAESLQGDCNTAISIYAEFKDKLSLTAKIYSHDGEQVLAAEASGSLDEATNIGERVAQTLIKAGALEILRYSASIK